MNIALTIANCIIWFYLGYRKGRVDGACSVYLKRRVVGNDEIVMLQSKYLGHDPRGSGN